MNRLIDISVELGPETVVWPGDRKVTITRHKYMGKGDIYNLCSIEMTLHAGTHIDAPRHFFKQGATINKLPLDAVVGKARVIYVSAKSAIEPGDLKKHSIKKGERLLLRTANSTRRNRSKGFIKDYVYLSEDAARYLAEKKLRCIGVDCASPGEFAGPAKVHRILMKAGVWIIENLDLSKAAPGSYELMCLPLKVIGAEGAPARAVLAETKQMK